MPAFDYLVCKYPLPNMETPFGDFQTYDTPFCDYRTCVISETGRLLSDSGFGEMIDTNFHGTIGFHGGRYGFWFEYAASFENGKVCRISMQSREKVHLQNED